MNKDKFRELLSHPNWLRLVEEIKERDSYRCTKCGSPFALDVYHKGIDLGRKPWEVKKKGLYTFCNVCAKNTPLPVNNYLKTNTS